ncbi:MAG: hypothetical protein JST00_19285 [Deltaproteobacteria bacterium]|nr:hypothetical protein [Deltaproteobacteria bacterium]
MRPHSLRPVTSSSRSLLAGLATFALLLPLLSGCGMSAGPRIRFVSATAAQLKAAEDERIVWYEFRQGDEVPLATLFTGVVEGGTGTKAIAKRTFWMVMEKNRPVRFSFDGEHVVEANAGTASIGLGRESNINHVAVVVYVGRPEDAPPELRTRH